MSDLSDAQLAMLRKQLERWRDNPTVIGAAGLGVNFGVVMDEVEALRADLAKAQAESEAAAKRWDEENASLAAQIAKAQARCAELEAAVRRADCHRTACIRIDNRDPECSVHGPLASDDTSALAAVRLAQRALRAADVAVYPATDRGNAALRDHNEALKALAQAFGEGE